MKNLSAMLMVCAVLGGCATAPAPQLDATLFADAKFEPASEPIRAADVFAVSPEMKAYLAGGIAGRLHSQGRTEVLVDALYKKSELRLEYDSVMTRNAAQAFAARSGNCLSLVIMTAAFAKELGVPVRYQSVVTDELWGRDGGIDFVIDHVNITLGQRMGGAVWAGQFTDAVTIDFLPPKDLRGQRQHVITEATVLAMYMNNRAAETLAQGHIDAAYWWAREALVQEPDFVRALNTLGVVYRRHGDLPEAERALRTAYAKQPSNPQIVFNLAQVLADQGQAAEARSLRTLLARLQPEATVRLLRSWPHRAEPGRREERARPLPARSRARSVQPRVPLLACGGVRQTGRRTCSAQATRGSDGVEFDARRSRVVRRQARPHPGARDAIGFVGPMWPMWPSRPLPPLRPKKTRLTVRHFAPISGHFATAGDAASLRTWRGRPAPAKWRHCQSRRATGVPP